MLPSGFEPPPLRILSAPTLPLAYESVLVALPGIEPDSASYKEAALSIELQGHLSLLYNNLYPFVHRYTSRYFIVKYVPTKHPAEAGIKTHVSFINSANVNAPIA